jgi:hypothetical protein
MASREGWQCARRGELSGEGRRTEEAENGPAFPKGTRRPQWALSLQHHDIMSDASDGPLESSFPNDWSVMRVMNDAYR